MTRVCGGCTNQQCSSPVTLARRLPPQTTHLLVSTASLRVAAAASRRCLHTAGCSFTTRRPVRTSTPAARRRRSCPSVDLYVGRRGCQILDVFLDIQGGHRVICESTCVQVYTVREFSSKIGLSPCEENCVPVVH